MRIKILTISLGLAACCAAPAWAGPPERGIVAPWSDDAMLFDYGTGGGEWDSRSVGPGLQAAADHIVGQQCTTGAWCWEHGSACCPNPPYSNIIAPIAMGLLQAHAYTGDAAHLNAAVAGAGYDMGFTYTNGEYRGGSFSAAFLYTLSTVTANSTYSDHAATEWFDELRDNTYGPSDWDTHEWISAVQSARSGAHINLRPWDFHNLPWVAGLIGNDDSTTPLDGIPQQDAFLAALLDGLDTLDSRPASTPVYWDLLGLAGGVRGLALNGTTNFTAINAPDSALVHGIDNLCDLADALVGEQNTNGSWYWHSNIASPGTSDEDTQNTAYAVMALVAAQDQGCGPYDDEIAAGRDWLWSMQDSDGGFFGWPGGTHNTEVEGEVLSAMTAPSEVWVDDDWNSQADVNLFDPDLIWQYTAFNNIQDGVNAVEGSTVNVAAGTYVEIGQILIDKDLTISGDPMNKPVIKPAQDTGSSGDARGWWLVTDGTLFDLDNVILDGDGPAGRKVFIGILSHGHGTISDCTIRDMWYEPSGPTCQGRAICLYDSDVGQLTRVEGCDINNFGRIGIFIFGDGSNREIDSNVITGKGDGDWLDYGIELGGSGVATITNNTVTDCRGFYVSWGSSGILATSYYGAGTAATITGNVISHNSVGIYVGHDPVTDTTTVVANNNAIYANPHNTGIVTRSLVTVDAENNWWGDATGPYDPDDGGETDDVWGMNCIGTPPTQSNPGGIGDRVSDDFDHAVAYCPWLLSYPRLTLEPDADCYETGDPVTVEVWMRDVAEDIVGGQFFLEYDDSKLAFSSADAESPFVELYEVTSTAGEIDYAVQIPPTGSVTGDAHMATITFTAQADICTELDLVTWRPHDPPSRLSDDVGGAVYPLLTAMDVVDDIPPVITCPDDVTIECDEPEWNHKMHYPQLPDPDGWDVLATHPLILADDWQCSETGPVLDVHFWGSWEDDIVGQIILVRLSIHADIPDPDGEGPLYSMPGELLWSWEEPPGPPGVEPVSWQGWYDPSNGYEEDDHELWFEYKMEIPEEMAFVQYEGTIYWLDIQVVTEGGTWGWKTSLDHWNDDAVWGLFDGGDPDAIVWHELRDPIYPEISLDLAFVITAGPSFDTGTATATDNCDPNPVITSSDVVDLSGCGGYTGTITRTWTATDYCGNSSSCVQVITVQDTTDPVITCPADVTVECDSVPAVGTATATDNCDPAPVVTYDGEVRIDGTCDDNYTLERTWTATDDCGNSASCTQTITVQDTTDPVITCPADVTVECDSVPAVGTATATDNCDPAPVVTYDGEVRTDGYCDDYYTLARTWTATDDCGNSASCTQTITVQDTTAPVLSGCPTDITVNADAGVCTAVVTWIDPTATDNCDPTPTVVCSPLSGSTFAQGDTTVTCTATDACGNSSSCTFTVTVLAFNDLFVTVELSPTMVGGPFTRCITFELWDCDPLASVTVTKDISFTVAGGVATGTATLTDVACGPDYECITARDRLHTLRRTATLTTQGTEPLEYVADFSAAAGKDLLGGNLNDDFWIDILDFGVFSSLWNTNPGANSLCSAGWDPLTNPHADINGDGTVWTADFTFISNNFLLGHEDNCCSQPGLLGGEGDDGPITEISVDELYQLGLGHLAVADLNNDGWLDEADVVAFMNGARPKPDVVPAEDVWQSSLEPGAPAEAELRP